MTQPVLFVSHGSPMLALAPPEHGYVRALRGLAAALPERPRAVLAVSAHWQAPGLRVSTSPQPGVMHDFGGFPPPLYELDYPAPGDPALAGEVLARLQGWEPVPDPQRPLDHGSWAVLRHLFPEATVPVVGLSLPRMEPRALHRLGEALAPLREEGVLLLASGGLVHNLRAVAWEAPEDEAEPWAREAEGWLLDCLEAGRLEELFAHRELWPHSLRAAPTTEHLDPLFVALGAARDAPPRSVHEGWQMGNLSLRILAWGLPG